MLIEVWITTQLKDFIRFRKEEINERDSIKKSYLQKQRGKILWIIYFA